MVFDPATGETKEVRAKGSDLPEDFVTGLLPVASGAWAGTYGGGVTRLDAASEVAGRPTGPTDLLADTAVPPPHPTPAVPPSASELQALTTELAALNEELPERWAVHLSED